MKSFLAIAILVCAWNFQSVAQAQDAESLKADFATVLTASKGPFGDNMLQGSKSRASIKSGGSAGGTYYFQAAFRTEAARKLALQGFYTGNLFTTNYYELTDEFVYQDTYGSFPLAHEELLKHSSEAMPRAISMVQNWVLEKYFVHAYPETKFAKGFVIRGIGGTEFEQPFAQYFFNFYLASITDDYQYLPAFLLAKQSPIAESAALEDSRSLITTVCDYFACGPKNQTGLWAIRNAIHNQMSESVIGMIDSFLRDNPWYAKEGNTYLQRIQKILISYYSFSAEDLAKAAKTANAAEIMQTSEDIAANGLTEDSLLALSEAVALSKANLNQAGVTNRSEQLVVIIKASQYLNAQLNRVEKVSSNKTVLTLVNTIYIEGFLIKDNWDYYHSEIANASVDTALATLPEIVEIGTDTLATAFDPAYGRWKALAPDIRFENFIDSTIKSSSLNNASLMASKK